MELLRVLLVEDEPLVSMQIEDIVHDTVPSVVIIKSSVKEAKAALVNSFHFALLDIDVTNGKTHDVARILVQKHIPFVFVSGSLRSELPTELKDVPFIAKPFVESEIRDVVLLVEESRAAEGR